MRFKLHLKPLTPNPQVMWNYHYPLEAWLYGILAQADSAYSQFLHERGYQLKKTKTFKHFTFSDLQAKIKFEKEASGFQIVSPMVQWVVSFYMEKAAESFIVGLFQDQKIRLFNHDCDVTFIVERVEILPETVFTPTMQFRASSAMVVAEKINGIDHYIEPTDPRFGKFLVSGLIDKYLSVIRERNEVLDANIVNQEIAFQLTDSSKIRSRKITIKENKSSETEVKGYRDFTFSLSGPKEVLEVGYYGGFGKYGATGLGYADETL